MIKIFFCQIPEKLNELYFGQKYNQHLGCLEQGSFLSKSLKSLIFGENFNRLLEDKNGSSVLPEELEEYILVPNLISL